MATDILFRAVTRDSKIDFENRFMAAYHVAGHISEAGVLGFFGVKARKALKRLGRPYGLAIASDISAVARDLLAHYRARV